jgi:hypothetical protein
VSHFTDRTKAGLCGRCGKPVDGDKVLCKLHHEDAKRRRKAIFKERRKTGRCVDCGEKSGKSMACMKCRAGRQFHLRKSQAKLKTEAFAAYGGARCACPKCPEHDKPHIEFLTINHMGGGGTKHRAEIGGKRTPGGGVSCTSTYRWLRRNGFPPGYNVLCWNCQWGHFINKGVCPHTKGDSL